MQFDFSKFETQKKVYNEPTDEDMSVMLIQFYLGNDFYNIASSIGATIWRILLAKTLRITLPTALVPC
jgi:hypothetical protein